MPRKDENIFFYCTQFNTDMAMLLPYKILYEACPESKDTSRVGQ